MRRRSTPLAAALAALPLLLLGCFDPTFPDGTIHCTIENDCPPGLECLSNHYCYALGSDAAPPLDASGTGGVVGTGGGAGTKVDAGAGGGSGAGGRHDGGAGGAAGGGGKKTDGAAGGTAGSGAGGAAGCNVCTIGDTRCGTTGLVTCVTVGACTNWGPDTACPGHQTCQGKTCQCPAAPSGCTAAGKTCDASNNLVTCAVDGQGCVYSTASTACPSNEPCGGAFPSAACTCPTKPSVCTGGQAGTFCDGNGNVVTCSLDAQSCLVASAPKVCNVPCAGTAGAAACGNCPTPPAECAMAGKVCSPAGNLDTCDTNSNGCLTTVSSVGCGAPLSCSGSLPNAKCVCPSVPAACVDGAGTACDPSNGKNTITCGTMNGCLVVTQGSTACPSPQICTGAAPTASCACPTDPLCQAGAGSYCDASGNLVACTSVNGCVQSSKGPCGTGLVCSGSFPSGKCACPSVPNCPAAGSSCSNNTLIKCTANAQSCLTEADTDCTASGLVCTGGACVCAAAPAMCAGGAGTAVCTGDTVVYQCSSDSHGCVVGQSMTCGSGQYCWTSTGSCKPPTPIGYPTDLGSTQALSANYLTGIQITLPAATLRSFGMIADSTTSPATMVSMGLYADSGGAPAGLVATANLQTIVLASPNPNVYAASAAGGGSLKLTAGKYWIMALYPAATTVRSSPTSGPLGVEATIASAWGNVPSSAAGATPVPNRPIPNYYVLVTE